MLYGNIPQFLKIIPKFFGVTIILYCTVGEFMEKHMEHRIFVPIYAYCDFIAFIYVIP